MLSVRNLAKSYGGARPRVVLRDISFDLQPGEYVAVVGESGSGKSTLLNLISGLDLPDAGHIVLEGIEITRLGDEARTRLRRARIGFVFQAFHLLPHLTVAENVALPLALNGLPRAEAGARVARMLEAVGMAAAAAAYPRELSGGEAQRVAIARALVHAPGLLLADEPTGNLDAGTAGEVLSLLRQAVKSGHGTGILVTHSERAAASADRVLRLDADGLHPAGAKR